MKLTLNLPIRLADKVQALFGPVVDGAAFEKFKNFTVDNGLARPVTYGFFCTVQCPPDHPALPDLFARLKREGWLPYFGYVPVELRGSHFKVRIVRDYDEVDLDEAMLLRVSRWGDFEGVIGFKQRSGDRWMGWTNGVGDELKGWNELCRYVDGANNFFAHTKLKNLFEERLQGIRFFPLLWDDPQAAQGEYWEIDTPHAMPPCLIPVVQKDDLKDYEEGPYDPPELAWRRREVEAMGTFDLAWTREVVGRERPNYGRHYLIVTQKFRRLCRELELPVDFIPTRLVEDDWIPPDPWRDLPFLAPSAPENA
ncbi:MAG: hypothetical protein JNK37_06575 [Verrucomicrobiales bacterium]|nr:hypothetical protein [Verrucomicrobiales bacterium]